MGVLISLILVRGSAQQSNPVRGSAHQSNPVRGSAQQSNPVRGSAHQSNPVRGSAQQSNPVRGSAHQSNPVRGSDHQSKSNPVRESGHQSIHGSDLECEPDHQYFDPAREGDPQLIADGNSQQGRNGFVLLGMFKHFARYLRIVKPVNSGHPLEPN